MQLTSWTVAPYPFSFVLSGTDSRLLPGQPFLSGVSSGESKGRAVLSFRKGEQ